jgi:hypothetical protein
MALHPNLELVFFAAPGTGFSKVQLDGARLVPTTERLKELFSYTSGGYECVEINSFDAFLVCGLGLSIPRRRRIDARFSTAVLSASYLDALSPSLNLRVCRLVRSVSGAPIYVGHNPIPSIDDAPQSSQDPRSALMMSYTRAIELISGALVKEGMHLIAQPQETFLKEWMTDPAYCSASMKLDVGKREGIDFHDSDDVIHMNESFGRLWMEKFLHVLGR